MLSLHEKTAERSPPLSPPDGTAIMSQSKPASSNERCARSFPAHNSMQPNGRTTVLVQSEKSRSNFLEFISAFMSAHPGNHISPAISATMQAAINSKRLPFMQISWTCTGNKSTRHQNTELDARGCIWPSDKLPFSPKRRLRWSERLF